MSREAVGAFIDAIYAIAVTILALELPGGLDASEGLAEFVGVLAEYTLAFAILFSFWVQHRRGNSYAADYERLGLWLNGAILLLVCLIPRATTLEFRYGGDVTLADLEATFLRGGALTVAEVADLFYVAVVLAADVLILVLLRRNTRGSEDDAAVRSTRATMSMTTAAIVLLSGLSFLLPVENRLVLALIPVALFFERELSALVMRGAKPAA